MNKKEGARVTRTPAPYREGGPDDLSLRKQMTLFPGVKVSITRADRAGAAVERGHVQSVGGRYIA